MTVITYNLPPLELRDFVSVSYDNYYPRSGSKEPGFEYGRINIFLKSHERILFARGSNFERFYFKHCRFCEYIELMECPGGSATIAADKCRVMSKNSMAREIIEIPKVLEPSLFQFPMYNKRNKWWMIRDKADGSGIERCPYRLGNVYESGDVCMGDVSTIRYNSKETLNKMLSGTWNRDVLPSYAEDYFNNIPGWIKNHTPQFQEEQGYPRHAYPNGMPWHDTTYLCFPNSQVLYSRETVPGSDDEMDRLVHCRVYTTEHQSDLTDILCINLRSYDRSKVLTDFPWFVYDDEDLNTKMPNNTIIGFIDRNSEIVYFNNDQVTMTFSELKEKGYGFSLVN